jgi:septum formation inhibitor-activating ATPase MinD
VGCEEKVHHGYIDFVLRDKANRAALLIEAKREGTYFTLPTKITEAKDQLRHVRLRTLATDPAIADAVKQAAQYCPAIGCQYLNSTSKILTTIYGK